MFIGTELSKHLRVGDVMNLTVGMEVVVGGGTELDSKDPQLKT